jgi:hypothetical protein
VQRSIAEEDSLLECYTVQCAEQCVLARDGTVQYSFVCTGPHTSAHARKGKRSSNSNNAHSTHVHCRTTQDTVHRYSSTHMTHHTNIQYTYTTPHQHKLSHSKVSAPSIQLKAKWSIYASVNTALTHQLQKHTAANNACTCTPHY